MMIARGVKIWILLDVSAQDHQFQLIPDDAVVESALPNPFGGDPPSDLSCRDRFVRLDDRRQRRRTRHHHQNRVHVVGHHDLAIECDAPESRGEMFELTTGEIVTILGQDRQPTMCAHCDEVPPIPRIIETLQPMRDRHADDHRRRPAGPDIAGYNRLHATPVGAELARPAMDLGLPAMDLGLPAMDLGLPAMDLGCPPWTSVCPPWTSVARHGPRLPAMDLGCPPRTSVARHAPVRRAAAPGSARCGPGWPVSDPVCPPWPSVRRARVCYRRLDR
jgi:hypothetical protein